MRPWVYLTVLLTACATTGVRAQPDAGAPWSSDARDAPSSGAGLDAGSEADFRAAVARFSEGDRDGARTALETFLARHPSHQLRPTVLALLGRLALFRGDASGAKALLESKAPATDDPGIAFVLGVAEARLGHGQRALALLKPFASSGPPSMGGTADEEAEMMLRTALAEALAGTGDLRSALAQWDVYSRLRYLREHEKAFARARAEEIAGRMSAEMALDALRASNSELVRAVLGSKAAAALRARGDTGAAKRLEEGSAELRRSLGFDRAAPWAGPGEPTRIGLAVPLSGRAHLLGEVALRGAMLAIGEPLSNGEISPFQVVLRDATRANEPSDPAGLAAARTPTGVTPAASQLTREEAVVGILGIADGQAIAETTRDGVPFLLLDEQAPGAHTTAFQLIHPAESRAAELARRALAAGARHFAVLAPDSTAGHRLADAFKRAVTAGGGKISVHSTYIAGATSFSGPIAALRKVPVDAVFVPDDADRLELVAPALAAADLWPQVWRYAPGVPHRPSGAASPGARREILLLSTARSLSRQLLKNAGKFVQGALLSPGFYAAQDDPRGGNFVSRYRLLYGGEPTATDAFSYDGIRVLRTAVEKGARTRADVLKLLSSEAFEGVTGNIRFGADHGRIDPPLVYTVGGDEIRPLP